MMDLSRKNDHSCPTRTKGSACGFIIALFLMLEAILVTPVNPAVASTPVTAHDFVFDNIVGGSLPLADYRGKTVLLVNTASQCGFTGQYEGLQTLWETYRDRGLVVIGVPSDDFGGQEPGNAAQIKSFCEVNFGIDFPMADKVRVKGPEAHPYYQWIAKQGQLKVPRWNFHKHLIDRDGHLVDWFAPTTGPSSAKLISAIEEQISR